MAHFTSEETLVSIHTGCDRQRQSSKAGCNGHLCSFLWKKVGGREATAKVGTFNSSLIFVPFVSLFLTGKQHSRN